jgi:adenosylcobinamide-GDP ribazoletransferase
MRAAVAFLTRIPVGAAPINARSQALAPALFPVVGFALGGVTYAVFKAAQSLGSLAAAAAATTATLWLTAAFHEDGLADTADGLMGAVSRERALEIMKDSRIGSYGAAALTLVLILRVALLAHCGRLALWACLLSGCVGRVGPVWLMTHVCHAAPTQSKHKDMLGISRACAYGATALALVASAALARLEARVALRVGVAWLAASVATLGVWRVTVRRLGGITGDVLGACEQVGEVVVLMVFAAHV